MGSWRAPGYTEGSGLGPEQVRRPVGETPGVPLPSPVCPGPAARSRAAWSPDGALRPNEPVGPPPESAPSGRSYPRAGNPERSSLPTGTRRDVTEAATSQAPAPTASPPPPPKSTVEAEGQQPPSLPASPRASLVANSVCMGMTGADGFPCCSKDSVDIVETQIDLNQHELQPAHEELQPTQEEPQPAQEEPQPAQEEPQPAQEELQPAQEEPQPAQEEPQPAQEELQPAQEEPQPAQEELQPAQEEPQPAQEEPQPAQEEPQPAQEEDEEEVDELLHLNVPPKADPEQDTKPVQEAKAVPPLEYCPPLEFCPASMLKPEAKQDSSLKVYNEDLESFQPLEGALTQQDTQQWNVRSSSITSPSITDEEQVDSTHRSIFVQTSKHLFWADKDIQASEYSLDLETGMQRGESTEKIASPPNQKAVPEPVPVKQFQDESTQAELSEPGTRQLSDTHLPSPYLTPAINLQDLVNFASSLAIASSSNRDLPNLGHMMKSPPQKAVEPSTVPMVESTTPPAKEPEQEKLPEVQERASEKSPEAGEPLESAKQEDKTLHPYFDFSKPEPQRTAFKGKVKFIRAPARSSSLNGDRKDSVPGTKKETPLMLKIHFKLLPTSSPREMTKQNQ